MEVSKKDSYGITADRESCEKSWEGQQQKEKGTQERGRRAQQAPL